MARAIEMRARRARVDSLRRDIAGLEESAGLLPPSPRQEYRTDNSRPIPSEEDARGEDGGLVPTAQHISKINRTIGFERVSPGAFAEEMVLRDAEGGVRLMPLFTATKEKGDGGSDSGSGGGGGAGGAAGGRRVGVRRLWAWLRGS